MQKMAKAVVRRWLGMSFPSEFVLSNVVALSNGVTGEIAIPLRAVRRVSAEEAKANAFSIYDVVLPLPGT